jgi:methylmalonyl-CoA mutase N-terminal domain/subunit
MEMKALYEPLDRVLERPGEYPFTRGIYPDMYRGRLWTMRQYSGFGTAEESNRRYHYLLGQGQTGLSIAFDLPTQMGLDSDDPLAEGEVGRVGMAVDSLRDFEVAFQDIPLDRIGAGLTINAVASIMLAMFQATAEKYGFKKDRVSATPQNDILKEMIGRGAWIFPVKPAVRLIGDTIEYSMKELPRTNPVSVCGYHIRESGCSPVQEIAYAFQIANTYIEEVLKRGHHIDDFVRGFTFNLNVFGNLWEQVAKFRAARKLWAINLKERYGAKDNRSLLLRGIFGGGGYGMTKAQPENNIIRGAYYALAAALGGAQTTALCSFDEAYTIPTPRAALLTLRTFQILMEESGMRDTVDPLAGSYFIETLTKQMEQKIIEEMKKIDDLGGMIKAVETGYVQKEVARQAYEFEKGVQKGELIKVGVNKHTEGEEMEVDLHEYRQESVEEQVQRLREVKRKRNNRKVVQLLKDLEGAARAEKNVMPYLLECCKDYATVGEMTQVFKEVYGEFKEPSIF